MNRDNLKYMNLLVNRKPIRLVEDEVAEPVEGATGQLPSQEEIETETPVEAKGPGPETSEELFVPSPDNLSEIDDYKFTDLLNRFRASPSFTEGDVRDQFDKFWSSLLQAERHFLYVTMLGFTQITLKGASATDAIHPHDFNLKIPEGSDKQEVEVVDGALPADRALEVPADQFYPIVVGESWKQRKWLQENSANLRKRLRID